MVKEVHHKMYAKWLGKYGLSQTGVRVTNTSVLVLVCGLSPFQ